MLQLPSLHQRARRSLSEEGGSLTWTTHDELEIRADAAVRRLRSLRSSLATGPMERLSTWLDRGMDTSALEYLDRPEYPQARKLRQVRLLHLQNRATGSYQRVFAALQPALRESAATRADRRARVLELACGAGELTLELARLTAKAGMPIAITGSDVVDAYVNDGNLRAREQGLDATFRKIDAFQLGGVTPGEFDVVFISQSIHHFSPGQLAKMIARAGELGARHFIGIDGCRSLLLVGVLPLMAAMTFQPQHTHDAFVSARRFYSEGELALVAEVAAPRAHVQVTRVAPAFSVLTVDYLAREGR